MIGTIPSYNQGESVTPDDVNPAPAMYALYVGGAGNITVTFRRQLPVPGIPATEDSLVDVVLTAVPVGAILPISPFRIKATGTTATLLVALR